MNPEHIVLDAGSGRLQMIYLPVSGSIGTMMLNKDSILRELFKTLTVHNINMKVSTRVQRLYEDLSDQGVSLWQIMEKIHTGAYERKQYFDEKGSILVNAPNAPGQAQSAAGRPYLILTENQRRMDISGTSFVLGKDPGRVNGIIYNHSAVSRQHCVILRENGGCYIQDLGSKNGTYVNGQYVSVGSRVALHDGDRIKLAECDLIFCEDKG